MSELYEYKCLACGGALEFDSQSQKLKCPYCDSEYDIADFQDNSFSGTTSANWNMSQNQWNASETDSMRVYICNSCGGEIVGDSTTSASTCPFCGNNVVMKGQFSGDLKPDFIIPFKLDKDAAKAKYHEHIKGRPLLPNSFKSDNHIDEIKGVYVPFWLFDSDISASANFEAENVREWSDSNYIYTEKSLYHIYREGTMSFNNIPCDGSLKMDDALMESIEPFSFDEAVPFNPAYLSGFFADKYDVDQYESAKRANNRILESSIEVFEDTFRHNYTVVHHPINARSKVEIEETSPDFASKPYARMRVDKGIVKYALYPVYLLTSTYKGEKYTFAMNGQTGKFVGNLPIDKHKKNLYFALSFVVSSVVSTIVAFFLNS